MNIYLELAALLLFQTAAPAALPDNEFVRVTRDAAPCANGEASTGNATLAGSTDAVCGGDRIFIALSSITVAGKTLQRGDVKVFAKGERYTPPANGEYLEVA